MRQADGEILIVDDDPYFAQRAAGFLTAQGKYVVEQAHTVDKAFEVIKANRPSPIRLIVLDVSMPPGSYFDNIETAGGHQTGVVLAREVRNLLPSVKLIINTGSDDHNLEIWFSGDPDVCFLRKTADLSPLLRTVKSMLGPGPKELRSFIVHGHDREALLELRLFIQNTLRLPPAMVLSELASLGHTVIEKFEHYAQQADVVFILLTPDDLGSASSSDTGPRPRTRQNVIFELGYFLGAMRRQSGRILLLHKGDIEVPSDIAGVVYIPIDHGVEAASEQIRRELAALGS